MYVHTVYVGILIPIQMRTSWMIKTSQPTWCTWTLSSKCPTVSSEPGKDDADASDLINFYCEDTGFG